MPVKTEVQPKSKAKKNKSQIDSVLNLLLSFDQTMRDSYAHIDGLCLIGIDEVGRGCLAGPVVAAATVLPIISPKSKLAKDLIQLNDSKKLNHQTRVQLAFHIQQNAQHSIAMASVEEIDSLNILQASFLAMKRSISQLMKSIIHKPENIVLLVDGNKKIPNCDFEQVCPHSRRFPFRINSCCLSSC